MTTPHQNGQGYSADIRMQLHVCDRVFSIGQLGPDFLILDDPADHPPADAEIAMSINGRQRRWAVHLPDGIARGTVRTRIV
jgi:hypothetical protein